MSAPDGSGYGVRLGSGSELGTGSGTAEGAGGGDGAGFGAVVVGNGTGDSRGAAWTKVDGFGRALTDLRGKTGVTAAGCAAVAEVGGKLAPPTGA